MIHRHLKNMNDFNKSRDALLNTLEGKEQDFLEHYADAPVDSLSIDVNDTTIQNIDETSNQLETLIETYSDYKQNNDEIEVEIEYEIESGHEGEQELEIHNYPVYDTNKEYGIILDCGTEHYYDEDNNVFNKQTKKYMYLYDVYEKYTNQVKFLYLDDECVNHMIKIYNKYMKETVEEYFLWPTTKENMWIYKSSTGILESKNNYNYN